MGKVLSVSIFNFLFSDIVTAVAKYNNNNVLQQYRVRPSHLHWREPDFQNKN